MDFSLGLLARQWLSWHANYSSQGEALGLGLILNDPTVDGLGPIGVFRAWGLGHSMYSLSLQCHLSVMVSPRGVSGVIMWFCYQLALDTSSLWGCHLWNWGKWYPFLELWGFANVYQHFPLCLAQKMSLILVAISLVIIMEEKLLKPEVRLPPSVNWNNLFETLLEMFGFTYIQFGFPVPWHPWERLFMVLGLSWWLGYLERDRIGMDRWCWNAVRAEVGVTGSSSSWEPRSLPGDHLTRSLNSMWSHMGPYCHTHGSTLFLTTERETLGTLRNQMTIALIIA